MQMEFNIENNKQHLGASLLIFGSILLLFYIFYFFIGINMTVEDNWKVWTLPMFLKPTLIVSLSCLGIGALLFRSSNQP